MPEFSGVVALDVESLTCRTLRALLVALLTKASSASVPTLYYRDCHITGGWAGGYLVSLVLAAHRIVHHGLSLRHSTLMSVMRRVKEEERWFRKASILVLGKGTHFDSPTPTSVTACLRLPVAKATRLVTAWHPDGR